MAISMNIKYQIILNLLVVSNILPFGLLGFFLTALSGELFLRSTYPPMALDSTPSLILIEAFGEKQEELILDCLYKHQQSPDWGTLFDTNFLVDITLWKIIGASSVISCCLAIYFLLLTMKIEAAMTLVNKRRTSVLILLILSNVLSVCLIGLFHVTFTAECKPQIQNPQLVLEMSPEPFLVEALGEDRREQIRECLSEFLTVPWGTVVYVNSYTYLARHFIIAILSAISGCLAIRLQFLYRSPTRTGGKSPTGSVF